MAATTQVRLLVWTFLVLRIECWGSMFAGQNVSVFDSGFLLAAQTEGSAICRDLNAIPVGRGP